MHGCVSNSHRLSDRLRAHNEIALSEEGCLSRIEPALIILQMLLLLGVLLPRLLLAIFPFPLLVSLVFSGAPWKTRYRTTWAKAAIGKHRGRSVWCPWLLSPRPTRPQAGVCLSKTSSAAEQNELHETPSNGSAPFPSRTPSRAVN